MATIYSIRELESLSGIKAHTIRIWEQRYGILKAARTETNIRFYSEEELKYLMSLALLNRNGYKISRLAKMTAAEVRDLVNGMINAPGEYSNLIDGLSIATIGYEEEKFERIIDNCVLQMGFEDTIRKVVFPFLRKLGMLWVSGSIIAGQEHFMTQLLRQKLIVAIDGQPRRNRPDASTFMLFLPNGEWHELSLLFISYLLRAHGHRVIYLGPSVPLQDVLMVGETQHPDFYYTIMTVRPTGHAVQDYLNKLALAFPDSRVIVSGNQVAVPPKNIAPNVFVFNDIDQIIENLAALTGEGTVNVV